MTNRIYPAALPNPCTPLGHDGSDFRAFASNVNGHLITDVESMPAVNVQLASGNKFFGFYAILEEAVQNEALSAGTNNLDGTPVPAGDIWCIQNVSLVYVGTVPTRMRIGIIGLAAIMYVFTQASPVSGLIYPLQINIHLQVGDYVRAEVTGATVGDKVYLRYAGLKMYTA